MESKKLPVPPDFVREALTSNGKKRNRFLKKLSNKEMTDIITYVIGLGQPDWATMLLTRLTVIHPYLKKDAWFKLEMNRFYDAYAKEIAKTNPVVKKLTDKVEAIVQVIPYVHRYNIIN